MSYYKIDKCKLEYAEKWCLGCLVRFPVSYTYNGGVTVDGEWYEGFKVAPPVVPPGFELVSIGIGYQLNARPPVATQYLCPLDGRQRTVKQMKAVLAEDAS